MRTRIIYHKNIWYNEKFGDLSPEAKNLALYLVANDNIGLTKIYRQPDKELLFLFQITKERLEELKEELTQAQFYFFLDGWVYINNDFSYDNYTGRDRLLKSKDEEVSKIPSEILTGFKGVIKGFNVVTGERIKGVTKGLERGYKPAIVQVQDKVKKEGGVGETTGMLEEAEEVMNFYNRVFLRDMVSTQAWFPNFIKAREKHSVEDIKRAILYARTYTTFGMEFDLATFFRTRNKNGECDYIADFCAKGFSVRRDISEGDADYIRSEITFEEYWNPDSPQYQRFSPEQLPYVKECFEQLVSEYDEFPKAKQEAYRGLKEGLFF